MYNDNPTTPEQVEDMEKEMNLNYLSIYFYLQKDFKRLVENERLGEKFRNNNHSVSIHKITCAIRLDLHLILQISHPITYGDDTLFIIL
jgi:hypothetical protein